MRWMDITWKQPSMAGFCSDAWSSMMTALSSAWKPSTNPTGDQKHGERGTVGVENEEREERLLSGKHRSDLPLQLLHVGGAVAVLLGEAEKEPRQRVVGVEQLEIVLRGNGELRVSDPRQANVVELLREQMGDERHVLGIDGLEVRAHGVPHGENELLQLHDAHAAGERLQVTTDSQSNVVVPRELHDPIQRLLPLRENVQLVGGDERVLGLVPVVLQSEALRGEDLEHGGVHRVGRTLGEKATDRLGKALGAREKRKLGELGKKGRLRSEKRGKKTGKRKASQAAASRTWHANVKTLAGEPKAEDGELANGESEKDGESGWTPQRRR